MVVTFTVDKRSRAAILNIQRIVTRWSDAALEASEDFGTSLQRSIKRHITLKRLIWKGRLWKSVRWTQSKNVGKLHMLQYGVELQEKRPRRIVVDRRMKLWRWAFDPDKHKGSGTSKALVRKLYSRQPIHLRRYDVYETPTNRTIARLKLIIKRHTSRVVQTRGRSV